jgi:hypothetical protein
MTFHGSARSSFNFKRMWNELTSSSDWCAIYCSETVSDDAGRWANDWSQSWQLGKIIGLIRPGGGLSNLKEKDDSGRLRWCISGRLERLELLQPDEVVPLEAVVQRALGGSAWPGKVQNILRGAPTKLEGRFASLKGELERALATALARVDGNLD